MIIRHEYTADEEQIHHLVASAFETDAEAKLVDRLRSSSSIPLSLYVSLVAVEDSRVVGHILLTQVKLAENAELKLLGMAPLAVSPEFQGTGIGSRLITTALDECESRKVDAIVVLGSPDFYGRFGFMPASQFGIKSIYDVEDKYFMLLEITPGSLRDCSGTVKYHEAFSGL